MKYQKSKKCDDCECSLTDNPVDYNQSACVDYLDDEN